MSESNINSHLQKLSELTEALPPLTAMERITMKPERGVVVYEVGEGTCLGWNLLNQKEVSVQRAFISKDTVFPRHSHETTEILIPFKGKIRVDFFDGKRQSIVCEPGSEDGCCGLGGCVRLVAKEEHSVTAITDCWMIGVSIPSSEHYPDAK